MVHALTESDRKELQRALDHLLCADEISERTGVQLGELGLGREVYAFAVLNHASARLTVVRGHILTARDALARLLDRLNTSAVAEGERT